eukprot:Tbor_TRINITY_DN5529_c1_g6::TRINITY_DN5529_c1_g6_i1::g.12947::m.12947/K18156/ATP23, XRCC6BP1; mitochondrial inner membrane protease ATP23
MCDKYVEEALKIDTVQYLISSVHNLRQRTPVGTPTGQSFDSSNIKCCSSLKDYNANAGYMWSNTLLGRKGDIVLDSMKVNSVVDAERFLKHELVHAFDDARGVVDPSDCFHNACSEIRAARLSGDCAISKEFMGGNIDIMSSGLRCVHKRATMAVENNPICRGFGDRAVEKMMPKCFSDYQPFVAPINFVGNFNKL